MYYLSCCIIVKNEFHLEEFIKLHSLLGVEHFYFYDNESDIPLKQSLKHHIASGLVDVFEVAGRGFQMQVYDHCLQNFGKDNHWIAFIDGDEFMIPQSDKNIPEILEEYSAFGGYGISWRIFGSSGHKTKPNGLQIENYTSCMRKDHYESTHIKSIVQPAKTLRTNGNPHCFVYKPGFYCSSEDFKVVKNAWTPHCSDKLRLNHYFLKSYEEFEKKVLRGRADHPTMIGRKLEEFKTFDDLCTEYDNVAAKYIEKIK